MDINKMMDTLEPEETGIGRLQLPRKDQVVFRPTVEEIVTRVAVLEMSVSLWTIESFIDPRNMNLRSYLSDHLSAKRVEGSFKVPRPKVSSMMASIDEDAKKSSQTNQDDVGSGVSSSGQNITESTVIQVEAQRLIQFDLIVMFFNVYSQTTEERSGRYVSTSYSEVTWLVVPLHLEVPEAVIISVLGVIRQNMIGVTVGQSQGNISDDRVHQDGLEPSPHHGRYVSSRRTPEATLPYLKVNHTSFIDQKSLTGVWNKGLNRLLCVLVLKTFASQAFLSFDTLPDIERKVLTVGILILRPGRKMEDLLYVKDYYLLVFTTKKPENKTDAEWTILHRQGIINQLACMGIKFEDEIQGLWLLGTLLDTWETFRTSLSNSAPDGVITMELAKGSILNEETRRTSQGSSSQSDHQKTPRKTPQLNGLAEQMNRTLVERVRCLLSHAGLPASFWGFGAAKMFHTVIYEFLDARHLLYDPVQKRLVRSRDVVFEEDQTLKDVENAERETIPQHNDDLIDLDLGRLSNAKEKEVVPSSLGTRRRICRKRGSGEGRTTILLWHMRWRFGDDIQNDEEHDEEQGADDVDAHEQPNLDEDVYPELPDMLPFLPLRRSTRDHHPSTRYSAHEYVLLTDGREPECYAEAMEDEHKKEWFEAMEDEMNSLHENNTFKLVKLPKGKRALKNKWVYKLKTEEHTSRPRYKARLVVKGFS
ncbi:retrovirus-related pol polyprotein from transposon TNT 1-94 [Tanacetum coccineum]